MNNNLSKVFDSVSYLVTSPKVAITAVTGMAVGFGIAGGGDVVNVLSPLSVVMASYGGGLGALYGVLWDVTSDLKEFGSELESIKQDLNNIAPK